MADALKDSRIKVDQTLHGYSEGHRLIEGSLKLSQPDARAMLVLSDASGSSGRIPASGYVTGYPLLESGKYVLARTWAAPEMSRPGCVWTHSLLIDFSDLARLSSAVDLLKSFDRPTANPRSRFGRQLEVDISRVPTAVSLPNLGRVSEWASALYSKPKSKIIVEREGQVDDELLIAIWMQQWPRLRRTFRFCSFVAEDRSTSNEVFDIQLISNGRTSRSRMISSDIVASGVVSERWVGALIRDLEYPSESSLRQFLRDVGADIANGRAAMAPLVKLYTALDPLSQSDSLAEAVSELEQLGPSQGRMGRAAAARVVLSRPGMTDVNLFEFALDQVRSDRKLLGIDPVIVGRTLLRWKPGLLTRPMEDNDPLSGALETALLKANVEELLGILAVVPDAVGTILHVRPELLELPDVWRIPSIDGRELFGLLARDRGDATPAIAAIVRAGRDNYAPLVVERYGIRPVVTVLSDMDSDSLHRQPAWTRSIARRTNELAECMATGILTHRPLLIALAQTLHPDEVPNSVGEDPWVTAVGQSHASYDVAGEDLLAAFLFSRARGWRTRSAGRLFFFSVQRLHEAMAVSRLSEMAWKIANMRLPGSMWRDWDRCEKLRHAVVDHFIDYDLPPIEFGTVIDDKKLWEEFVVLAADSSRGRRYLKKVSMALQNGNEPGWHERAKLIERKIK